MNPRADCPLCGTGDNHVVIREHGWQSRKCSNCDVVYVSPRPGREEVAQLYAHKEDVRLDQPIENFKRRQARVSLRLIREYAPRGGSLLELGPGDGFFLDEAKRQGFNVHAIELNVKQAEDIATRGIDCESQPLHENSFDGQLFDVIYFCDVLSHFYDPVEALQTIRRHIRTGGILVFETGNLGDVDPKYYSRYPTFLLPEHLFLFGEGNFPVLLQRASFAFTSSRNYNILPSLWFLRAASKGERAQADSIPAPSSAPRLPRIVRSAAYFVLFALKYGAGRMLPKSGRPQTVLVVARAN
jgi:SAM-dependent methyltransferase